MPNWCQNVVTFTHEDATQIERLIKAYSQDSMLNEFVPVPEDLKGTNSPGENNPDLVAKYGYDNWFDWCVSNWGTKWDVSNDGSDFSDLENTNSVTLSFDTAWSPPLAFYESMESQGFQIKAYYYEPGMGFCGIYEDGADDEFEIDGDSQWVVDHIPQSINEMFAIAESMEMWEEENQMDDETYSKENDEE